MKNLFDYLAIAGISIPELIFKLVMIVVLIIGFIESIFLLGYIFYLLYSMFTNRSLFGA